MRDSGNALALREVVRSGRIGEIQTMSFAGQHPLLRGERPNWYFEPGMHGGTLNDIAVLKERHQSRLNAVLRFHPAGLSTPQQWIGSDVNSSIRGV